MKRSIILISSMVLVFSILISSCQPAENGANLQNTQVESSVSTEINEVAADTSEVTPQQNGTLNTETPAPDSVEAESEPSSTPQITATYPSDPRPSAEDWRSWPVIPDYIPPRAKEIYQHGLEMGTDPHAFSVTGDCQAIKDVMFWEFDDPRQYYLDSSEQYLQESIDYFQGSFNRNGMAVRGGFTAASVLSTIHADPEYCEPGETPLGCEFRLHNPSILIVSLEVWNDREHLDRYELYLRGILDYSIERGVLPILMTKADMAEALKHVINPLLTSLALEYQIPLANFWLAAQALPDQGIDPDRDGFHISKEAWSVKSFTGLKALDAVWRYVNEEGEVASAQEPTTTPTVIPTVEHQVTLLDQVGCENMDYCVLFDLITSEDDKVSSEGIFTLDLISHESTQILPEGYVLQDVEPSSNRMLFSTGSNLYSGGPDLIEPELISDHFVSSRQKTAAFGTDQNEIVFISNEGSETANELVIWNNGQMQTLSTAMDQPSEIHAFEQGVIYWQNGTCPDTETCNQEGLWKTEVETGQTEYFEGYQKPVISSDGTLIAFQNPENEVDFNSNYKLLLENTTDGILSRRVIVPPAATGFQVRNRLESYTWSPDGTKLQVFWDERSNYYERTAGYHNFVLYLDGGLLLEYDLLMGIIPQVVWSPDNIYLLLSATEQLSETQYVINFQLMEQAARIYETLPELSEFSSDRFIYINQLFWLSNGN